MKDIVKSKLPYYYHFCELFNRLDDSDRESNVIKSHFIVTILNEKELSDLKEINDKEAIYKLRDLYSLEMIKNSHIEQIEGYSFILPKKDAYKLTEEHLSILRGIVNTELHNPIYIEINEDGELLID